MRLFLSGGASFAFFLLLLDPCHAQVSKKYASKCYKEGSFLLQVDGYAAVPLLLSAKYELDYVWVSENCDSRSVGYGLEFGINGVKPSLTFFRMDTPVITYKVRGVFFKPKPLIPNPFFRGLLIYGSDRGDYVGLEGEVTITKIHYYVGAFYNANRRGEFDLRGLLFTSGIGFNLWQKE